MLNVPLPANEAERQQALDRLELLDTPADPYLDTLTRLAHDLFQVKMALVTLVDRDRQWFKSRQGLDVAETPRSLSYCSHAVLRDEPLIVEDSQVDERFAGTELARGTPDVRFYAGWPLHDATGLPLGTLCLANRSRASSATRIDSSYATWPTSPKTTCTCSTVRNRPMPCAMRSAASSARACSMH